MSDYFLYFEIKLPLKVITELDKHGLMIHSMNKESFIRAYFSVSNSVLYPF